MDPAEWRERVGRQLEVGRRVYDIPSMRAAAKIAGFSEATWRQLETGERRPSPGVVIAPSPKITTLTAAARTVGLDPIQLAADADIYSDDDIRALEDEQAAMMRLGDRKDSIAQTMVRNAEGLVGFRTGPPMSDRAAAIEARLEMVLRDLSLRGRQQVLELAERVLAAEWGHEDDELDKGLVSSGGGGTAVEFFKSAMGQKIVPLRVAADEGSADPHDDEVGEPSVRHQGGSDPEPGPGE